MEKINVAEILRGCPIGTELDSTIFEKVKLKKVFESNVDYPICIETISGLTYYLTKYGQVKCDKTAKCVIFPKNGRNWEAFQRPFKEGDVIFGNNGACSYLTIFKGYRDRYSFNFYVSYTSLGRFRINDYADSLNLRLATEKERQKLFEELKSRGYQWNDETKTLIDLNIPKFKVGDRIRNIKNTNEEYTITAIYKYVYDCKNDKYSNVDIWIKHQDEWEIVTDKFDISSLVPFETKVLVRDCESDIWKPAIFGGYIEERERYKYNVVGGIFYEYLIPYENNEHLCYKSNNCNPYYQTWNK